MLITAMMFNNGFDISSNLFDGIDLVHHDVDHEDDDNDVDDGDMDGFETDDVDDEIGDPD